MQVNGMVTCTCMMQERLPWIAARNNPGRQVMLGCRQRERAVAALNVHAFVAFKLMDVV